MKQLLKKDVDVEKKSKKAINDVLDHILEIY